MNQECFYHYKKAIKYSSKYILYATAKKKKNKTQIIMNLGINLPQIHKTLAILTNF